MKYVTEYYGSPTVRSANRNEVKRCSLWKKKTKQNK